MATVAQLAARAYQEVGYLLVVDGWPVAFTNRVELAGSGVSSWIGTTHGARTVALGLEPPARVKLAIGVVETGMPIDDALTLTIVDREGYLVDLMTDEAGSPLLERLGPGTTSSNPAPSSIIVAPGDSINPRGKWVDGEAIGSSGERRQFAILPGATLPGPDHPASNAAESTLRPAAVRDEARWLEGLPCALYLIRKDVAAGTWPSWQDQHDSGYSLIWWGSLRGAEASSRAWQLHCDGPSSWLRKTLNVTAPTEWRKLASSLSLGTGEDKMAIALCYDSPYDDVKACAVSAYTGSDALTSGQTPADLALEINTRLQTLVGTAGADATFDVLENGQAKLLPTGVTIKVDDNNAGAAGYQLAGIFQLRMHAKAWLHLGWDLVVQGVANIGDCNTPYEVKTVTDASEFVPVKGTTKSDPAPGYWEARFTTLPLGQMWSVGPIDGNGAARTFLPVYGPTGPTTVLQPEGGQTLNLGWADDAPYWIGQLAKPPADVTLTGGACDRAGFIVVRGPFLDELDGEVRTVHQLARISWAASVDEQIAADANGNAVAWLEEWLDPSAWGGADEPLDAPWAIKSGQVEWMPVSLLSYKAGEPEGDAAHAVLLRLLLSSGTAAWTGAGETATVADGDNAKVGVVGPADDREVADLGLCVPAEMVDWDSFEAAAEALPGGRAGALSRCRIAKVGPFDSQELIERILAPRGWCFSLAGGRYGLFARSVPLDYDAVEVTLTQADVAGDPDEVPPSESVDLRPLEPVDLVSVRYGASPWDDAGRERELQVKARDPRAQVRRGNAKVDVDGSTLLPTGGWAPQFIELWGDQLARFYGEPHALVRVSIKGDVGRDLWPGTIVAYTSPWPATRTGAYGMTSRVGRVVSTERDLQTLAVRCEILVEGTDPLLLRRFGPIARLVDDHATVEERHDAAARTVYCYADAFGRGGSAKDVEGFAEPSWSTVGGAAVVHVWQSWDGLTWEQTASFEVESVSAANDSITYKSSPGLTGTIWESRFGVVVLAPYDDQTASTWPLSLLGVTCGTDGKFGTGNAAGYPWQD